MPTPEEIERIKAMVGSGELKPLWVPKGDDLTGRIAFILGASPGLDLIAKERLRQIDEEGFEPAHDDGHIHGELVDAAVCYLWAADSSLISGHWPFNKGWWKPRDRLRNLVRAGALIAAEIDRLKRAEEESTTATDFESYGPTGPAI